MLTNVSRGYNPTSMEGLDVQCSLYGHYGMYGEQWFYFLRFSVIQLFALRFERGFLKLYYVKDARL